MDTWDVIIVGGGPAGLMAAIAARDAGARTLLLEKGRKLGRKLGISGGGRCNVTNAKPLPELLQNIPGNGRFVQSALHRFGNEDIFRFFEGLGIRLKEEDRGRVFPVSDKAATVVSAMIEAVKTRGVEIELDEPVNSLLFEDGRIRGVVLKSGGTRHAQSVVLSTGGCSVPQTGSTGDAYPWAQTAGHTIVDPYPTEVPLTSNAWFIRDKALQGLSLRGIEITIRDGKGKRLTTESGDLIFTHFGLSGPAALRCSHYVSTARRRDASVRLTAEIDLMPDVGGSEGWNAKVRDAKKNMARKAFGNVVAEWLPDRLANVVLTHIAADSSIQMANVKQQVLDDLVRTLSAFPVPITGTLPLAQATVTGGGVSVKEIDPRTMASKLCEGLFFAGELMDVHAHTGGYNITVAFSTGHLAGTSAAAYALEHASATTKGN